MFWPVDRRDVLKGKQELFRHRSNWQSAGDVVGQPMMQIGHLLLWASLQTATCQLSCDFTCSGCTICYGCYSWSPCYWFPDDEVKCRADKSGGNCPYPNADSCGPIPTSASYQAENAALQQLSSITGGTWFDASVNHCELEPVSCEDGCSGSINRLMMGWYG